MNDGLWLIILGTLILLILAFAGCSQEFCRRKLDGNKFRCMKKDEISKEYSYECESEELKEICHLIWPEEEDQWNGK